MKKKMLTRKQKTRAAEMLANKAPVSVIAREIGASYWLVYRLKLGAVKV